MVASKSKTPVDDFLAWLRRSGLSSKTIRKHAENVDFYINEFLLYEDAQQFLLPLRYLQILTLDDSLGQAHGDNAALPDLALGDDRAMLGFDQRLGNGQPQSDAGPVPGLVPTVEALKDVWQRRGINAWAGVADAYRYVEIRRVSQTLRVST